ncbi:Metacaspase-1 [Quillaja saponaria]|uniref:Metacaspase-1 n=1 Tax=Quillaja saponaria TaxID=32244 RepID=A0AAD7M1H3_QUISA|nr:Metacaspase-1 [Quillaja saponaria]
MMTCRNCKKEFSIPPHAIQHRCLVCHTVNTSIHGDGLRGQDQGRHCSISKWFKDGCNVIRPNQMPSDISSYSSSQEKHINKRALLCGVTYRKKKLRLKGTINDVKNMKELLVKRFHFPDDQDHIRVLTEEEKNPNSIPTKKNIEESLKWLVKDCQPGDSLVFYFSGHGLRQPDFIEDERDGFDETICPTDFIQEGMIPDNYINSTIVWPLKVGVKLHAIVDSCHSGTILDLIYVYDREKKTWSDNSPPSKNPLRKSTSGGKAICLSACGDDQMAADTSAFRGKGMNGVMTYLLVKIIRENQDITYGELLEKMHDGIGQIKVGRWHRFLGSIFHQSIIQDPLLSSSQQFDVFSWKFTL